MGESIDEMIDDIHLDDEILSDCCGAPVYPDTDICSECGEHCGTDEEQAQCQITC